ncbi:MAG TPA: hypothetical protein VEA37_09460 [Flavobacterium sp.]|nr:hypothetical protein [Flavobacterium sp.]
MKKSLVVFISVVVWVTLVLLTQVNGLPSDGLSKFGFPMRFLEVSHNLFVDEYLFDWSILGLIANFLFILLIGLVVYLIRRKIDKPKD